MIDDPTITFWPQLLGSALRSEVVLSRALNAIKTGGDFIDTIQKIREQAKFLDDPEIQSKEPNVKALRSLIDKLKRKLPGVSFAGKFESRHNDKLIEASGFMCLDIDHCTELPEELRSYTYAYWLSPSGKGLKVLIRVPIVKDDAQYKTYFYALEKKFPMIDKSGKDISRLTYFSYDPTLTINDQAIVWTERLQSQQPVPPNRLHPRGSVTATQSNYAKMIPGLKLVQQSPVGDRHQAILKAGKLMGGYIAGNELLEEDVLRVFEKEVYARMDHPSDFKTQWKTFTDGVKYGKELPLKSRESERKKIKAEFKNEETFGDAYYTAADVDDQLDDLYKNGYTRGLTTGWKKFDEYYSVLPGYFSLLYGAPGHAKTTWLFNLLINLSRMHGWIHAVFSPETGSARDVYAALIEIYCGGEITNTYKNQINENQYQEGKAFVDRHFIVIDNETDGLEFTMENLLLYIGILEKKFNVKINSVTIDPLIELERQSDERDDLFWNKILRIVRVQAKVNQWHIFLITHIIRQTTIGRDGFGNPVFPIPTPFDIYSGQTFYRKGFQILCFYRHIIDRDQQGPSVELKNLGSITTQWNSLFVIIQKTKPKGVGKLGRIEFLYDPRTSRYTDPLGETEEERNKQVSLFQEKYTQKRLPYKDDNSTEDEPEWVKN